MENMTTVHMPAVMNAKDVARYLGISKQGAYNLMNSGSFPTLRVGKRLLVPADKFLELIYEHSDNVKVEI